MTPPPTMQYSHIHAVFMRLIVYNSQIDCMNNRRIVRHEVWQSDEMFHCQVNCHRDCLTVRQSVCFVINRPAREVGDPFVKISSEHLHPQTVRAKKLKFWEKGQVPPPVTCHMSLNFSFLFFSKTVVKLVTEGMLSMRPIPSSLQIIWPSDGQMYLRIKFMSYWLYEGKEDCLTVRRIVWNRVRLIKWLRDWFFEL